ncbi:hypothetical protein ABZS79_26515 [Streptomyces griseoloalbus]|uniref:hypothetical protein n=1 Tax=Streptomyces griseoloalbus TaxID=67303 RepID=UPI0033A40DE9
MVSDATSTPSPADGQPRRRFDLAHSWTNTVAGLAALALSAYNFIQLERDPDVDVSLPHIVRVAQGQDVWLYLQPTLSTRLETQKVEVVTEARLKMERSDGDGERSAFFWDETGSFSYDADTKQLTYQRVADPSPLIVSRDKPQQPVMLFNAVGWNFAPGRYEGTLTLNRASGRSPLVSRFCVMVSDQAAASFKKVGQFTHRDFRDDVPNTDSRTCYVLSPI